MGNAGPGLLAKLLEAQTIATTVEKKGRNQDQGYDYAQASDVIEEAQRALHEAGLVGYLVPGEIVEREVTSRSDSAGLFVTITSTLRVVDPESGDDLELSVRGTGIDYPGDKAVYKAMTGAAKYAYASLLGIPFGDDPEADTAKAGQDRRSSGAGPATGPQKGAITRLLNRAGLERGQHAALVHAISGEDPLSKQGASNLLDLIAPLGDDQVALEAKVAELWESNVAAGDPAAGSDIPPPEGDLVEAEPSSAPDDEDLPEVLRGDDDTEGGDPS